MKHDLKAGDRVGVVLDGVEVLEIWDGMVLVDDGDEFPFWVSLDRLILNEEEPDEA